MNEKTRHAINLLANNPKVLKNKGENHDTKQKNNENNDTNNKNNNDNSSIINEEKVEEEEEEEEDDGVYPVQRFEFTV